MRMRLFLALAVTLLVMLPVQAQGPASQSSTDIRVTIGFVANNPCNGDIVTGTGDLHIHQHIVSPGGAGFPGLNCHILDKFHGSGTGDVSGLSYKVRADGAFTGVNGILNINPANGAIVFQDDVRFVFDPIGAGSQGAKFTARIHQGVTIAFNSGNINTHLQLDPGSCRN